MAKHHIFLSIIFGVFCLDSAAGRFDTEDEERIKYYESILIDREKGHRISKIHGMVAAISEVFLYPERYVWSEDGLGMVATVISLIGFDGYNSLGKSVMQLKNFFSIGELNAYLNEAISPMIQDIKSRAQKHMLMITHLSMECDECANIIRGVDDFKRDMEMGLIEDGLMDIFWLLYEVRENSDYGGSFGNLLFGNLQNSFVIPFAADCITHMRERGIRDKAAVLALLRRLGHSRGEIARWSKTKDWPRFGKFFSTSDNSVLCDFLDEPPWKYIAVKKYFIGFLPLYPIFLNEQPGYVTSLDDTNSNHSGVYGLLRDEDSVLTHDDVQECERCDLDWRNDFSIIFLHNKKRFWEFDGAMDDFFSAAIEDSSPGRSLTDDLLRILHKFSHSTTYSRGQAAITGTLLKAIARSHGYELEFKSTYCPPKNPNYDQWALLYLHLKDFLQACGDMIILTNPQSSDFYYW